MKKYFSVNNYKMFCEYPTKCPICGNLISPERKSEYFNIDIELVAILFACPACGKGFLSHYKFTRVTESYQNYNYNKLEYLDSFPKIPKEKEFNDLIKRTSSIFCEIYNQSYFSEFYGFKQLSGMGYRKSLEFLIKDFCIYKKPDDESKIKDMLLSQVINTYIDSEKIKSLAKVSTWLGNDETHYTRKFEDRDIEDLKMFIDATVAFISYELIADEATKIIEYKNN